MRKYFCSIIVGVCFIFLWSACEKTANPVIGDGDANNQTIIINRDGQIPDVEDNSTCNAYSNLTIFYNKKDQFEQVLGQPGTYIDWLARVYTVLDTTNDTVVDFGSITLANQQLPLLDTSRVRYGLDGISIIPLVYQFYDSQRASSATNYFLGEQRFQVQNSPDIQDIDIQVMLPSTTIDFSDPGSFQNNPVDPNQDWTVDFSQELLPGQSFVMILEEKSTPNGGLTIRPTITIQLVEATSQVTIPSAELQRINNETTADRLRVGFIDYRDVGDIELRDNAGSPISTMDICFHQSVSLTFSFQ